LASYCHVIAYLYKELMLTACNVRFILHSHLQVHTVRQNSCAELRPGVWTLLIADKGWYSTLEVGRRVNNALP
jgi:hypothetical protein